jgi:hypothetical protein
MYCMRFQWLGSWSQWPCSLRTLCVKYKFKTWL